MIIHPDNETPESPSSQAKSPQSLHAAFSVPDRGTRPPPSYAAATSAGTSERDPLLSQNNQPKPPQMQNRNATWRFAKAVCAALLIYCVAATFLTFVVNEARGYKPNWPDGGHDDGSIVECLNDDHGGDGLSQLVFKSLVTSEISDGHFELPISSHYFLSRGRHASGTIRFLSDPEATGDVQVDLRVTYREVRALEAAKICLLEKRDGSRGLGIYTDWDHDFTKELNFKIEVRYPTKDQKPLAVNGLAVGLPMFDIGLETQGEVFFHQLVLHTSNAKIVSDTTTFDTAAISTSNAPVAGEYNVTDSIVIATSNAKLDVTVNLENEDDEHHTSATLTTTNGLLDARINLFHDDNEGGFFDVVATTSNGRLDVKFNDGPLDHVLGFLSATSNAKSTVHLPTTFDGTLRLINSNAGIIVQHDDTVEDPAGLGRHRTVKMEKGWSGWLSGWVAWGDEKPTTGANAFITTSNGQNLVYV